MIRSVQPADHRQHDLEPRRPKLSTQRKWLFRFLALSLPLLALGLTEAGLRLGGYGYDCSFFREERDAQGQNFLVNNDQFTFRFFPPELSRCPPPFKIAANKPPGRQRIFIFGESAAMGDPQPSVGPAHILEVLLREKFPGEQFEVVNLGITAINSHVILPLARDVAARGQGDIWILYLGNNEMVGPFGAATVFGSQAAPLAAVRFNLAIQRTRVGQLAVALLRKMSGGPPTAAWGGMKMFLENQVPPNDPRRSSIYQSFERNLKDIVDAGLGGGAKVVLSTVSVNLRDCPPFGSMPAPQLTAAARGQFASAYTNGIAQQDAALAEAAIPWFARAAEIDPDFAELQFRWAQCLDRQTNPATARDHFQRACDVDTLPFRADTRINETIRLVGRQNSGERLLVCDAEAVLASAASAGIAGGESFFEHVHFNFDGNYRLAKTWAEPVTRLLPEAVRRKARDGWADQDFCERAIGLSDWNRMAVIATVRSRLQQPPLASQFTNSRRTAALQKQWGELAEGTRRSNAVVRARAEFERALVRAPDDHFLRENFAGFLKSGGDKPAALTQYQKITEWLPHDFYARLQVGRLLGELGQWRAAESEFLQAAAQRPYLPDGWFELGVVQSAGSNYVAALASFERVVRMQPSDVSARTYRARILARLDRRTEAIHEYRRLIQANPARWEAHLELAELYAVAGEASEAIPEYQAAVQLNPRQPDIRINLGITLAQQNRLDEALEQFQAVLALMPTNAAAQKYLREVIAWRDQRNR